jgi:hypothetical protein
LIAVRGQATELPSTPLNDGTCPDPRASSPLLTKLWVCDLRANMHFTLKTNPLKRSDLDEFVRC